MPRTKELDALKLFRDSGGVQKIIYDDTDLPKPVGVIDLGEDRAELARRLSHDAKSLASACINMYDGWGEEPGLDVHDAATKLKKNLFETIDKLARMAAGE